MTDPNAVRVGEQADRVAAMLAPAVGALRGAAAVGQCDWGVDYAQGPATKIPHLNQARALANAGAAYAQWLAANGKPDEAMDHVEAVMALGRDVDDKILICHLVRIGIVEMAVDRAARVLPLASAERAKQFGRFIAALPPGPTVAEAIAFEGKNIVAWLRPLAARDGAEPGAGAQALASVFRPDPAGKLDGREAVQVIVADPVKWDATVTVVGDAFTAAAGRAALPDEQFAAAEEAFRRDVATAPPLVRMLVPSIGLARLADHRHRTMLALLDAAVQVVLDGPAAVADTVDPAGGGQFAYEPRPGGFVLASKVKDRRGEPVLLVVGEQK
ncbi:MAG TPA: hypothetical protein VK324_05315 [Tepidisphaeraceae bacterium]|nr:hypothetical protein [Tepidisphaeraceae bacterium]